MTGSCSVEESLTACARLLAIYRIKVRQESLHTTPTNDHPAEPSSKSWERTVKHVPRTHIDRSALADRRAGSTSGATPLWLSPWSAERNGRVHSQTGRPGGRGTGAPVCHAVAAVPVGEQILGIPPGRPQSASCCLLKAPYAGLAKHPASCPDLSLCFEFGRWPGDRLAGLSPLAFGLVIGVGSRRSCRAGWRRVEEGGGSAVAGGEQGGDDLGGAGGSAQGGGAEGAMP